MEGYDMRYESFIGLLKLCETKRVKSLSFPDSCSLNQIPEIFGLLIPDVVAILDQQVTQFCEQDEVIAIFGMQLCGGLLTSSFPEKTRRIIHSKVPEYHLCCTLDYLTVQPSHLVTIKDWSSFRSIIIDFTRGLVMDGARYLAELFPNAPMPAGKLYGSLDPCKLAYVWEIIRHEKYCLNSGRLALK